MEEVVQAMLTRSGFQGGRDTTPFSFIAAAEVIRLWGITPVFVALALLTTLELGQGAQAFGLTQGPRKKGQAKGKKQGSKCTQNGDLRTYLM